MPTKQPPKLNAVTTSASASAVETMCGRWLVHASFKSCCSADIRSGRLVSPFGVPQPVSWSYFFATTAHTARLMRVDLFREWLLAEARALQTMDEIIARRIRPAADMMAAE